MSEKPKQSSDKPPEPKPPDPPDPGKLETRSAGSSRDTIRR
jgi:hypothetical protein